jgi:hypothetical protein
VSDKIIANLETKMANAVDAAWARRICATLALLGIDPATINTALEIATPGQHAALIAIMGNVFELSVACDIEAEAARRAPADDETHDGLELLTKACADQALGLYLAARGVIAMRGN